MIETRKDSRMTSTPTLTDFLLARIAEDEDAANHARWAMQGEWFTTADNKVDEFVRHNSPARVLAECESKRRIVELHQSWPVLVETPPELTQADNATDMTMRLTRRIAWLTQEEYRKRFGAEPPTAPMLRALALPYADHPDYLEEWRPA